MNVSIGSDNNVTVDKSYDSANIISISNSMLSILQTLKVYDPSNVTLIASTMEDVYNRNVNFQDFLNDWEEVLGKVVL